jgi:hypothetical protein
MLNNSFSSGFLFLKMENVLIFCAEMADFPNGIIDYGSLWLMSCSPHVFAKNKIRIFANITNFHKFLEFTWIFHNFLIWFDFFFHRFLGSFLCYFRYIPEIAPCVTTGQSWIHYWRSCQFDVSWYSTYCGHDAIYQHALEVCTTVIR